MSESELRDLLHRVVPEGEDVEAGPLASAGRRRRARLRLAVTTGVAAVAGAVVLPLAIAGAGGSDNSGAPSDSTPTVTQPTYGPDDMVDLPGTLDFYPDQPCDESNTVFGGPLEGPETASVALCQIFSGLPEPAYPLVPEVVVDPRVWLNQAKRSDMTRMDCNLLSSSPQGLLFVRLRDRTTRVLDEGWCATVQVNGEPVVVRALYDAFIATIDSQRSAAAYSAPEPPVPGCAGEPYVAAPVRPGRELLVGPVVLCRQDGTEIGTLSGEQAGRLRGAWNAATQEVFTGGFCRPVDRRYLRSATNRGDVLTFTMGCGLQSIATGAQLGLTVDDVLLGTAD